MIYFSVKKYIFLDKIFPYRRSCTYLLLYSLFVFYKISESATYVKTNIIGNRYGRPKKLYINFNRTSNENLFYFMTCEQIADFRVVDQFFFGQL